MIGNLERVSVFLKQLKALVLSQQVWEDVPNSWTELEPMTWTTTIHQNSVVPWISPVNYELLSFGARIITLLSLVQFDDPISKDLLSFFFQFLNSILRIVDVAFVGDHVFPYFKSLTLPIWNEKVVDVFFSVIQRRYPAELVLFRVLHLEVSHQLPNNIRDLRHFRHQLIDPPSTC